MIGVLGYLEHDVGGKEFASLGHSSTICISAAYHHGGVGCPVKADAALIAALGVVDEYVEAGFRGGVGPQNAIPLTLASLQEIRGK